MKLDNSVAIITGAGRGIGRAMAEHFAAAGSRVALLSRSGPQLEELAADIRANGGQALPVAADVTDLQQVRAAIERVLAEFGTIHTLINNAGSFDCIGPVAEIDPDVWWRDCEINLRGPLHTCHAVLPHMLAQRQGLILNVIGGGTGNPFPYGSGYASSKAGLMRLTECLAGEVREQGVTVFALGPGFVRTTMTEYQADSEAGRQWIPSSAEALAKGLDIPPDRAAQMSVQIAHAADRLAPLTGRLFSVGDDVEAVIAATEDILARNTRTLRFCS